MNTSRNQFAYLLYGVTSISVGLAAGWFGLDLIHNNDKATDIIVTVFSILAGFLIAAISLLGDSSLLPKSWRFQATQRKSIKAKLIRQKGLFYLYLFTLAIIFITTLTKKIYPETTEYLERLYFGVACTAFLLSFRLPSSLMAIQLDRIDAVIGANHSKAPPIEK